VVCTRDDVEVADLITPRTGKSKQLLVPDAVLLPLVPAV
jgi:hypothetical protein